MDEKPRTRRRWFQYSLRTLLILTTACAALFAWWSHKAQRQRAAVAAITKAGGSVTYEFQTHGLQKPRYWPAWLVHVLGVDYVASVDVVSIIGGDAANTRLESLQAFTRLKVLCLLGYKIRDDDLQHIKDLRSLEDLNLSFITIGDAELKYVRYLDSLKRLTIAGTLVTDAGLENLSGLTALQYLDLGGTQVTDAGLEHLRGLSALQEVDVTITNVTDAGVARLKQALPNCQIVTVVHIP